MIAPRAPGGTRDSYRSHSSWTILTSVCQFSTSSPLPFFLFTLFAPSINRSWFLQPLPVIFACQTNLGSVRHYCPENGISWSFCGRAVVPYIFKFKHHYFYMVNPRCRGQHDVELRLGMKIRSAWTLVPLRLTCDSIFHGLIACQPSGRTAEMAAACTSTTDLEI